MTTTCPTRAQPMPAPPQKPALIRMDARYQTRDGRKVTLYCVDAPTDYCVHGRIDGFECPSRWSMTGKYYAGQTSDSDLIEAPPPAPAKWTVQGWKNIYLNKDTGKYFAGDGVWDTEDEAKRAGCGRIACVPITLSGVEGEGLRDCK